MKMPLRTIGSICDVKTGKLDANASSGNGAYPFFTCSKEPLRINTYSYEGECILVAGNGDLNVKYYNGKFDAYQRTYIISLKKDIEDISVKYLYSFFQLYVNTLREKSIGGVIKYIKLGDITEAKLPIPPLAEQERIVAELDLLTGIIDKQKAQLKELDTLAQSIFYDMFGDPVENEKGWKCKKVIEVVKLQRGYDLPCQDRCEEGTIPIYGSNGIVGYHNKSIKDFGIITGRSGTLGKVYSSNAPFFPLNTTLFSVDTHGNNIIYLQYLLTYYDLKRFGTGTGVPTLNRNEFHERQIIDVPISLQESFSQKIFAIDQQKQSITRSIADTQKLFDYTMDKYFG